MVINFLFVYIINLIIGIPSYYLNTFLVTVLNKTNCYCKFFLYCHNRRFSRHSELISTTYISQNVRDHFIHNIHIMKVKNIKRLTMKNKNDNL